MDVHQHQVEVLGPQAGQGLAAVAGRHHQYAGGLQHGAGHGLVGHVVVDHQHPRSSQVGLGRRRGFRRRRLGRRQGQHHGEGRAFAETAVHRDRSAHHPGQLPTDRQAQTGAAEPARDGRVALDEGREELGLLFRRHSRAGVGHRDLDPPGGVGSDPQLDPAFLSELQRVRHQVQQDLAHARRIARQPRRGLGVDLQREAQALASGGLAPDPLQLAAQRPDVEGRDLELQLASLDLRQVQNVVEDGHQAVAGLDDGLDIVGLPGVQLGRAQGVGHAQHPVHRRTQLMAHHRQEGRLGAIGFLRLGLSLLQRQGVGPNQTHGVQNIGCQARQGDQDHHLAKGAEAPEPHGGDRQGDHRRRDQGQHGALTDRGILQALDEKAEQDDQRGELHRRRAVNPAQRRHGRPSGGKRRAGAQADQPWGPAGLAELEPGVQPSQPRLERQIDRDPGQSRFPAEIERQQPADHGGDQQPDASAAATHRQRRAFAAVVEKIP